MVCSQRHLLSCGKFERPRRIAGLFICIGLVLCRPSAADAQGGVFGEAASLAPPFSAAPVSLSALERPTSVGASSGGRGSNGFRSTDFLVRDSDAGGVQSAVFSLNTHPPTPLSVAHTAVTLSQRQQQQQPQQHPVRIPPGSPHALWYWAISALLVVFAGFASGLTVGLMSLDPVQLKVLELEGTDDEKRGVKMVSDIIRRHHLLLVTLLLANSLAMEALPIFLDRLVPSWAAVLLSVTAILLFGEILPQALCTGRNQLAIAQTAAPLVNFLIALFFVAAWPIAKLLDSVLGHGDHHAYYARAHLKALIRMHERERRANELSDGHCSRSDASSALGADEVNVIEGALDLANKTLKQIMMPMSDVFMLEYHTPLNRETFQLILATGHSRVPIYSGNRNNVKGFLLTKSLLAVDPNAGSIAGEIMVRRRPIFAHPDSNLYDLLNEFQKGHSHIAFVTTHYEEHIRCLKAGCDVPPHCTLMGIATLEDVIEELIQEEIYDEFDKTETTRPPALHSGHAELSTSGASWGAGVGFTTEQPSRAALAASAALARRRSLTFDPSSDSNVNTVHGTDATFKLRDTNDLPEVVKELAGPLSTSGPLKKYGPTGSPSAHFNEEITVPFLPLPRTSSGGPIVKALRKKSGQMGSSAASPEASMTGGTAATALPRGPSNRSLQEDPLKVQGRTSLHWRYRPASLTSGKQLLKSSRLHTPPPAGERAIPSSPITASVPLSKTNDHDGENYNDDVMEESKRYQATSAGSREPSLFSSSPRDNVLAEQQELASGTDNNSRTYSFGAAVSHAPSFTNLMAEVQLGADATPPRDRAQAPSRTSTPSKDILATTVLTRVPSSPVIAKTQRERNLPEDGNLLQDPCQLLHSSPESRAAHTTPTKFCLVHNNGRAQPSSCISCCEESSRNVNTYRTVAPFTKNGPETEDVSESNPADPQMPALNDTVRCEAGDLA